MYETRYNEWHEVPGFESYLINSSGQIILRVNHHHYPAGHTLRQHLRHGKACVGLVNTQGKRHYVQVRKLLMQIFCGPQPPRMYIRHVDGDIRNHSLANMEYAICKTYLREPKAPKPLKLSADDVAEIRRLCSTAMLKRRIAERFNVHPSMVTYIHQGKRRANAGVVN